MDQVKFVIVKVKYGMPKQTHVSVEIPKFIKIY